MISDQVLLALITAIPSTIAALGALIVGLRTRREVEQVSKSVDGLLEKNVAVNRSDAAQSATLAERERGEAKAADAAVAAVAADLAIASVTAAAAEVTAKRTKPGAKP